jgi:CBS domain-containing protein
MPKSVGDMMLPEPLTLDAQVTLQEAARRLRQWDVEDVLVVDDGRFVGILALSNVVVTAIASGHHPAVLTIGECCEPSPYAVSPDDPASHAADLMARHRLQRLPVVEGDRLVGTIWASDLGVTTRT